MNLLLYYDYFARLPITNMVTAGHPWFVIE